MIRSPAVAGRFYPSNPDELRRAVDDCAKGGVAKESAMACIVPHAGYMYSGAVAGRVYDSIEIPARVLILGPRHFPRGEAMAILSEGEWQTPLGEAKIDAALAAKLKREMPSLREDEVAHRSEHSIEVQLPFLQRLVPDFRFVPVAIGTDQFEPLEELGLAVARVVKGEREPVLVITSTDMNHYESDAITRVKDGLAIEKILALDAHGLYDTVRTNHISMCGAGPAVAMLTAMRELHAKRAELLAYATSGDVTSDRDWVVGYAGFRIQ